MTRAFVDDVRRAAAGVRLAVDQAMAGFTPVSRCRACAREYFFLTAEGLKATEAELCPRCDKADPSDRGLGLESDDLSRMVSDRRGLVAVAHAVASSRRCTEEDAVLYLERLEAQQPDFRAVLGLAKKATADSAAAWRAALLCWTEGLALAAAADPVAAQMARLRATARPEAVARVVVRLGKKVLYDGPVTAEAGRVIREGEDRHGRKLRVKLHHTDGRVTHRRGERETAPENVIPETIDGGVRAMLAERAQAVDDLPW